MTANLKATLEARLGDAYTVDRELGGGGMSRVFLAEERALGRKVVIKVLPAELAAEVNVERFRREIQLAAKLQHPYIVPVLSTGVLEDLPYYVMPFIEGESLRARLQRSGEFPVNEAVGIMRDVFEALAYAHECGVVHRDIKPENVLMARHHAHVADFGVAKALSASTNAGSGLTSLGVALGTPAYMSPEQAMADPNTDHRADLYDVGVMAYEMLTGYQVFSQRSPQAMLAAHATEQPEPVEKRRTNVPPGLAALIMRLLQKRPADRPQSADEALAALNQVMTPSGGMAPTAQMPATSAATVPVVPSNRRTSLWVGVGAAALLLLSVGAYVWTHRGATAAAAADPQNPSIAVLPFENMSGDAQNDYLGDGLSEELIGGLSRVRGLQVAARTSSFAFKGKNEDVRAIGTKLGVGSVLGGSVRKAGNKLRVSVQLTSVSTGYNLWSETYDREMRDVFAVEDEISHAIVSALEVRLKGGETQGQIVEKSTNDPEAYDLYLKGRFYWNQRGASLTKAEDYFKRAVARDSSFALAWSGLADTYATMSSWGMISPTRAAEMAPVYAERAVSLAPNLPEPHISLGFARCHLSGESEVGLREIDRAIQLSPNLAGAHYFRSLCLVMAGRPKEAIQEGVEAQRLDPLNAQFSVAAARAYIVDKQPDSAIAVELRAIQLSPNLGSPYVTLQFAYAETGDTAKAREVGEKAVSLVPGNGAGTRAFLAILEGNNAAIGRAKAALGPSAERQGINIAYGYALRHNADSALVWLTKSYEAKADVLGQVEYPAFDWLRSDPRFKAIAAKYAIATPRR